MLQHSSRAPLSIPPFTQCLKFSVIQPQHLCVLQRVGSSSSKQAVRNCKAFAFENNNGGGKGMNWFHEMNLQVREHELDSSGIVKNSVYANYCDYGIHDINDEIGFDSFQMVISEFSLKFIAPLKRREKFLMKVRIYNYSGARLFYEHLIFKQPNQERILEAKHTLVLLDNNFQPIRISRAMISKFDEFRLCEIGGDHKVEKSIT